MEEKIMRRTIFLCPVCKEEHSYEQDARDCCSLPEKRKRAVIKGQICGVCDKPFNYNDEHRRKKISFSAQRQAEYCDDEGDLSEGSFHECCIENLTCAEISFHECCIENLTWAEINKKLVELW